jgi:hypothetical protein
MSLAFLAVRFLACFRNIRQFVVRLEKQLLILADLASSAYFQVWKTRQISWLMVGVE